MKGFGGIIMRVKTEELQIGCILSEDVFSMSSRPIIKKKTILTSVEIDILNVFLIKNVEVGKTLINGLPFVPAETLEETIEVPKEQIEDKKLSLSEFFLQSVQAYKKEFQSWQAGLPVNISKVRNILLPLLEKFDGNTSELFTLHHFSTKEEYIYQHSVAVGLYSGFIAKKLRYNKGDVVQIALAGILSDCGMSKLSTLLLNKGTSLNSDEYEEIKRHTNYSFKMVKDISLLNKSARVAIIQHHERLDGTGYPFGNKADKIHPYAKIIAVADTFHAMTSHRLYREKQSPFKVLELIQQEYFGEFDIQAINALSIGIINFSIGNKVKLSNGQLAEILFIDEKSPTRPVIKENETNDIIDLAKNRQLFIDEVVG